MNFYKHIEYKPGQQIWRILPTDDDKVVIEKRDTEDKQVYFDCIELENKNNIFKNLQLEEKFWIGIETIQNGIILFHKFAKPDMPGHKEIIAFDMEKQKILWQNEEFAYLFLYKDKVYCYKELFEGRKFLALNHKTGEVIEELGEDAQKINEIYDRSRAEEKFSSYIFPQTHSHSDQKIQSRIDELKSGLAIFGDVEYNILDGTLLTSYHIKKEDNSLVNKFSAIDIETGEEKFSNVLCENIDKFMTDSFFVYKEYLFLLKEKTEIMIYKID